MAVGNIKRTKHRYSDVVGEPCKMLGPIFGFNEKPLVSLEEAVAPIQKFVPDITAYAYCAKRRVAERREKPDDGLSIDESAAIVLYTMEWEPHEESLYYIMNRTLRTEEREKLKPWFLYLKLILTALSRLPSISLTVYRRVNSQIEGESHKYQIGRDIVWWGFSSCSQSESAAKSDSFLGEDGKGTLFILGCSKGKDISKHSYYEKEQEIILLPSTKLQVTDKNHSTNGLNTIRLREIQSPFILLEHVGVEEEIVAVEQKFPTVQRQHTSPIKKQMTESTNETQTSKKCRSTRVTTLPVVQNTFGRIAAYFRRN